METNFSDVPAMAFFDPPPPVGFVRHHGPTVTVICRLVPDGATHAPVERKIRTGGFGAKLRVNIPALAGPETGGRSRIWVDAHMPWGEVEKARKMGFRVE